MFKAAEPSDRTLPQTVKRWLFVSTDGTGHLLLVETPSHLLIRSSCHSIICSSVLHLCLSISSSTHSSIDKSIRSSVCLSIVCPSIVLMHPLPSIPVSFIYPSIHQSICPSFHPLVHSTCHPSMCLPFCHPHPLNHPPTHPPAHLSITVSIHPIVDYQAWHIFQLPVHSFIYPSICLTNISIFSAVVTLILPVSRIRWHSYCKEIVSNYFHAISLASATNLTKDQSLWQF